MDEDEVRRLAEVFAKENKKLLAKELTDTVLYPPDPVPVSVFMAGSPGAGKTEFSKALLALLEVGTAHKVLRIDSDDFRSSVPGYTGKNSYLFQGAVSVISEKVHDLALDQNQTFVFDGTFSKYDKAVSNIQRSLGKGRHVFIFYVYQKPEVAWKFTKARERIEGRHIPRAAFIEQFLGARNTVEKIQSEFAGKITVFLVKKDFEKNTVSPVEITLPNSAIDAHVQERYSKEELEQIL